MSWIGCPGPRPFGGMEYIEDLVKEIKRNFGVSKDKILFGFGCVPSIDTPCEIYVRFRNDAVEYFYKSENGWANWNYEE